MNQTTLADRVMQWSRPVIALFGLALFAVAFFMAYEKGDTNTLNLLCGAIVALVSTISGYYFGSSSASERKDEMLHSIVKPPAPPAP